MKIKEFDCKIIEIEESDSREVKEWFNRHCAIQWNLGCREYLITTSFLDFFLKEVMPKFETK